MLLSELLELNYSNRTGEMKKTEITEVYGIIYRIHCIPENMSYIGQTFSHKYCKGYLQRWGLIGRCKVHYRAKDYEDSKNRPLYIALFKYRADQFRVYEEQRIYKEDLARLNQFEAEYIQKYNSMYPNGYNMEEVGKKYSKLLKNIAEVYGFDIQRNNLANKERKDRGSDICFGKRFGLKRQNFSHETILETLKTITVDSVRLIDSNGLRILVRELNQPNTIRIYFQGTKEECVTFAKKICGKVYIEFDYKYQTKLDKLLLITDLTKVRGKIYKNKSNGAETYSISFYGKKDGKSQIRMKISFGGKNCMIKDSINNAMEFLEKYKAQTTETPTYSVETEYSP